MGRNRTSSRLEDKQIEKVIALSSFLSNFLHNAAGFFDALTASLTELKASRLAIKRGAAPMSTHDLTRIVSATDAKLAHILQRCEILKYELGRLHIETDSGTDLTSMMLYKDLLKSTLKKAHGVDYMIKITPAV